MITPTQTTRDSKMVNPVLFVVMLILVFNYSTSSGVEISETSLVEHIKKIEEVLAEQKSYSLGQEKHLSAVLSNLLSQQIQNSKELRYLEAVHNATILKQESTISHLAEKLADLERSNNATILKLEEKDAELSELWTSHNATVSELHDLRAKHNNVVVDWEERWIKLEEFENRPDPNGYIGFQGRTWHSKNVTADQPIPFDRIIYNTGTSQDQSIGKFLIPMNGTYLIWLDLSYRQTLHAPGFKIRKDDYIIDTVFGSLTDPKEASSSITMYYLLEGESIWVTPARDIFLDYSYCNFGIVLLNAH